MANTKRFHRHFETPGLPLYWIIIVYIILGWFFPVIGLLALICMIGPVVTSIFKRQHVRSSVVKVLTPSSDSQVCAYLRIPPVYGVLHLRHVRHPTEFCALERRRTGYVGWHRQSVLDDSRDDHHRWCHALVHLCPTHMVFVLPHGNHLKLGSPQEGSPTCGIHQHPRIKCLSDEVQAVCPCLPDAAHTLRLSWRGCRLSASRLSEVWQVCTGLSHKDYDFEALSIFCNRIIKMSYQK